jgi:hypothetical protein
VVAISFLENKIVSKPRLREMEILAKDGVYILEHVIYVVGAESSPDTD